MQLHLHLLPLDIGGEEGVAFFEAGQPGEKEIGDPFDADVVPDHLIIEILARHGDAVLGVCQ